MVVYEPYHVLAWGKNKESKQLKIFTGCNTNGCHQSLTQTLTLGLRHNFSSASATAVCNDAAGAHCTPWALPSGPHTTCGWKTAWVWDHVKQKPERKERFTDWLIHGETHSKVLPTTIRGQGYWGQTRRFPEWKQSK